MRLLLGLRRPLAEEVYCQTFPNRPWLVEELPNLYHRIWDGICSVI